MSDSKTPIIIAIITSITTIIAPLLTLYFTNLSAEKDLVSISKREEVIDNIWQGYSTQLYNNKIDTVSLMMDLDIDGKKIKGTIKIEHELLKEDEKYCEAEGGFYDYDILILNYRNKNQNIIQFGTYYLKLSSDANQLKGKFIGYGQKSEKIITGDICYNRI